MRKLCGKGVNLDAVSERISSSLEENVKTIKNILEFDKNFDIVFRNQEIGNKKAGIFFIDGFIKDTIMERLLKAFSDMKPEDMPEDVEGFADKYVPYVEVELDDTLVSITKSILSGQVCLLVDGFDKALIIDCRTYPGRSVSEPWKDRVLRGSRDGFVETVISNVALIRRRIRDPRLCVESLSIGEKSQTDVAFLYMSGVADSKLVCSIRNRLSNLKVEALTMNIESLAESLLAGPYINPFPKFKYSERPDTAASSLLDGNIVLVVDNSPAVIILPTSIFDIMEEADDFYFPPVVGTYLKLSRFIMAILTLMVTPLWMVLVDGPGTLPGWLKFIELADHANVPIFWQFMLLEFCIDGLRLAAVNTPSLLSTPLSLVAGIVVGEYAVSSGWFNAECMLYMSFVAVGTYAQPNFELGYALKFFRLILLVLTHLWDWYGFAIGLVLTLLAVIFNRTLSNCSYIYPLIPFNFEKLKRKVFRMRLPREKKENTI